MRHLRAARILLVFTALAALAIAGTGSPAARAQTTTTAIVAYDVVNVRAGPGTNYTIVTTTIKGATFTVVGRNAASDWAQVCCVRGGNAWIYRPLLAITGPFDTLPIAGRVEPPTPTPLPGPSPDSWQGQYYANGNLQGAPAATTTDPQVSLHLGRALPGGEFSVRWTRQVPLEIYEYNFWARADSGVRLYLDNVLVIDAGSNAARNVFTGYYFNKAAGGIHTLTLEYLHLRPDSAVGFWWAKIGQQPDWQGEYYNNIDISGNPVLMRNDPRVDFNWGLGSPAAGIPADNFSIRWTRPVQLAGGSYDFFARPADGVRIFLDNWRIMDEWHDNPGGYVTYTTRFADVGEGWHIITVDYYARGGIAYVTVWWQAVRGALPSAE